MEEDEDVLVEAFAAGVFQTNCFVVAPGPGESAVVVDPGQDAEEGLREVLARHRLTPVAVLLTHGHMDHMWSVTPVCDGDDIPAWIHPEDRHMLADPLGSVGPMGQQIAAMYPGLEFREPRSVEVLADGAELELAGLRLTVDHTPGHTRGSVVFRSATEEGQPFLLAGDTLFQGSIGRTDLPGGNSEEMMASLRDKILSLPDETAVLPGHGPMTTVGQERTSNPFVQGLTSAPGRHL
ncbi:MBL fold metallo-hydrolase [Actinomycetospora straminea]|uniref:MBL fold metallo-hydrolase n=1 Tax=Actinomycetospora straminea TaxID=663607 RepID=A0ABP9DTU0_9PSEU